jgi:hypothetical protein
MFPRSETSFTAQYEVTGIRMPRAPGNIKVIVAAGVPLPQAIKAALPCTLAEFAEENGFPRPHVSMCIHGVQRLERVRDALAPKLGVDREWLDEQFDSYSSAA